MNLHILPWALCWLASIGAGPENQKEHHYQHHNKPRHKIDKTSAENLTWPSPHHCTAASWPFRPRTLVPLHPHKSNVLLVCCLSLNISILKKKCCYQAWYLSYLRPRLPLRPRLVEAGVVVAPEPGSDPSAQVLPWIEFQNNNSEAPIMERPKTINIETLRYFTLVFPHLHKAEWEAVHPSRWVADHLKKFQGETDSSFYVRSVLLHLVHTHGVHGVVVYLCLFCSRLSPKWSTANTPPSSLWNVLVC